MIHNIKCLPEYFAALQDQTKNSEVRENDRDYQVDDLLIIHEFDPKSREGYTGRVITRLVTHVLRDFPAVDKKYVVLSLGLYT